MPDEVFRVNIADVISPIGDGVRAEDPALHPQVLHSGSLCRIHVQYMNNLPNVQLGSGKKTPLSDADLLLAAKKTASVRLVALNMLRHISATDIAWPTIF